MSTSSGTIYDQCSRTSDFLRECIDNSVFNSSLVTTMLPACRWVLAAHQLCLSTKKDNVENIEDSTLYKGMKASIEKELNRFPSENKKTPTRKICCDCRETKRARDACLIGSEDPSCQYLIKAHNLCLMDEGFEI